MGRELVHLVQGVRIAPLACDGIWYGLVLFVVIDAGDSAPVPYSRAQHAGTVKILSNFTTAP